VATRRQPSAATDRARCARGIIVPTSSAHLIIIIIVSVSGSISASR